MLNDDSRLKAKQIMEILSEVESNANHPVNDRNHPEHQPAKEAVQSLRNELDSIFDDE